MKKQLFPVIGFLMILTSTIFTGCLQSEKDIIGIVGSRLFKIVECIIDKTIRALPKQSQNGKNNLTFRK